MKLAILGTGWIIEDALPTIKSTDGIDITAICARPHSKYKAEAFAKEFSIPEVYTDFNTFLAETSADTVYVALANCAHYSFTREVLRAGKHVILEKPFTVHAEEAAELIAIAKEKNVLIIEAVTTRYMPILTDIREALPKLGQIRLVQANFSQYSSRYDRYKKGEVLPAFDPAAAGGALYDLGCYNLNFILSLFGKPQDVSYTANIGFNGIDTSGTLVLKYKDFLAIATAAKDSSSPSSIIIQGENGHLVVHGAANDYHSFDLSLKNVSKTHLEHKKSPHRMVSEFRAFVDIWERKDFAHAESMCTLSLAIVECLEKARKSAGIIFKTSD